MEVKGIIFRNKDIISGSIKVTLIRFLLNPSMILCLLHYLHSLRKSITALPTFFPKTKEEYKPIDCNDSRHTECLRVRVVATTSADVGGPIMHKEFMFGLNMEKDKSRWLVVLKRILKNIRAVSYILVECE
jgi:hypothetical protein